MSKQQTEEQYTFEKVWLMFQENEKRFKETDKKFQDTDDKFKKLEKFIKEIGKQVGGLNNKFGSFNEGLLLPSIKLLLIQQFKCEATSNNYFFKYKGKTQEIDVLGFNNACYIVEIKSHLREEAIEQIKSTIEKFISVDKTHKDKKKYAMLCATQYSDKVVEKVLDAGIYFISVNDNMAQLSVPEDFVPRAW